MKKILILLLIVMNLNAGYYNSITNNIDSEKAKTLELIDNKKEQAFKAIENYKKTLEKKKKSLSNLLYQLTLIETLLKAKVYKQEKILYNKNN